MPIALLRLFSSFNVTRKNLSIAFPDITEKELLSLSKESYAETAKSFYETLYTWSRTSEKIINQTKKINNRFLFSPTRPETGLIVFAIHNRSIDFLLRWISSQRKHTSLYKNKMTCMAADQVPADGLGKFSTFFGHECFSFSLAPALARKTNKSIIMASLSYDSSLGHIMTFNKPDNKIYNESGVDTMNREMEDEIRKCPKEYSWEYKKFRKLSQKPSDIYKD